MASTHNCTSGTYTFPHTFAGTVDDSVLGLVPRGLGYGPPEINLAPIYSNTSANILANRYAPNATSGSTWLNGAGNHYMNCNKWFQYGDGNYWNTITSGSVNGAGSFGAPPDTAGGGFVGIDWGGRPLYCYMGYNLASSGTYSQQSPYELNLAAGQSRTALTTAGNVPFSLGELERLLRPYDRDATSLPGRLFSVGAATTFPTGYDGTLLQRIAVTTDSWDVPASISALPGNVWVSGTVWHPIQHATDVLVALLQKRNTTLDESAALAMLPSLFPPEVLAGRKMDLNRALGNGLDDDGNGLVDETRTTLTEGTATAEAVALYTSGTGTTSSGSVTYTPAGSVVTGITNSLAARQLYARYLYVLAALLVDKNAVTASPQFKAVVWPDGMTDASERYARFLAQWAVNVVDFYDRDSIMTPFEYCVDPFTTSGWTAGTGKPTSTTHVVWGCERPELLISETLAFHDRRTEDLDTDNGVGKKYYPQTVVGADTDFDQRYKPQGSLFIELYNPQSDLEPTPKELCSAVNGGVDLTKTSGTSTISNGDPVWRLAMVKQADVAKDPDDMASAVIPERTVYFTSSTVSDSANVVFCPNKATFEQLIAPILPGRYAVIGPGESTDTTSSTTLIGGVPTGGVTGKRRIVLTPSKDPDATGQVQIINDGTTDDLHALEIVGSSKIKNATAIVVNSRTKGRCNFSISEPNSGYKDYTAATKDSYDPPEDKPLDKKLETDTAERLAEIQQAVMQDKRTDCLMVVHLQRLANPLLPYNPISNPYRTIDSMPIDLMAFNGLTSNAAGVLDPQVTVDDGTKDKFYARQRGASATLTNDLWMQESLAITSNAPKANAVNTVSGGTSFIYSAALNHTFGYLNDPYGVTNTTAGAVGDPSTTPFPWFAWNNRQFISSVELALVPWANSSQLLSYTTGTITSATALANPYDTNGSAAVFPRLLNFLSSGTASDGCEWSRLLDFTGVPSRFVGTDIQINPATAESGLHLFHTPFNRIPNYREPGKVNLNTLYDEHVFCGLLGGTATNTVIDTAWSQFVQSRRGFASSGTGTVTSKIIDINSSYPTQFARPFRSTAGGQMVPLLSPSTILLPDRPIDSTLLRATSETVKTPLVSLLSVDSFNAPTRNPFFYYQMMQRLQNLTTTRSNVFAVWMTVGYFEVTPNSGGMDAAHPDGYQLGRELGSDTGETERHRAFYMIDRTIPVGFQRGKDLNVEKAMLIKRFIE